MYIRDIELEGFRNYDRAAVSFDEGINVITGGNANGKTNLLESVFYLTCGRSFRVRGDRELIGHDRDRAAVKATVFSDERLRKVEVALTRGGRKSIAVNGVKLKKISELSGVLNAVLFCPDDLEIVRGAASVRRRFMNLAIAQLKPRYALALAEYGRLYEHKTRILKDFRKDPVMLSTLDDFNSGLAEAGAEIVYHRAHFVKRLNMEAARIHRDFSKEREELSLVYKTVKTVDDPCLSPKITAEKLMAHLESHRTAEIETGLCLSGPHKDEVEIFIDGYPARNFASQGQARTAALSLKLAERDIFESSTGDAPVLLLDDVLSELDSDRQEFVLNRISRGQILITCCEDRQIIEKTGGRVIKVENGVIETIS